jgi:hypothetical protein
MVELPSFDGATEWLNSGPLTPQALRGRVVLVSTTTSARAVRGARAGGPGASGRGRRRGRP